MRESLTRHVYVLTARLSHLGAQHDLACMTLAELWGLYRYLHRIANG